MQSESNECYSTLGLNSGGSQLFIRIADIFYCRSLHLKSIIFYLIESKSFDSNSLRSLIEFLGLIKQIHCLELLILAKGNTFLTNK